MHVTLTAKRQVTFPAASRVRIRMRTVVASKSIVRQTA